MGRIGSIGLLIILVAAGACSQLSVPPILGRRGPDVTTLRDTSVCVVDESTRRGLRMVAAKRDRERRLYLLERGRPVAFEKRYRDRKGGDYAQNESWFRKSAPIEYRGRRYVRYGARRVIPARALALGSAHEGVRLFLNPNEGARPEVLYVPVQPGCIFQPYLYERSVPRGSAQG